MKFVFFNTPVYVYTKKLLLAIWGDGVIRYCNEERSIYVREDATAPLSILNQFCELCICNAEKEVRK